jgi:undecaprenyl-diphosphatase
MLSKDLLRKEINTRLSNRLGLTLTVGLALGLALSLGVIYLFAQIAEEVAEGETRRFDTLVLLRINAYSPDWLDAPMRFVTALGYYWVVLPLLAVSAYAFYRRGRRISAALLVVSTCGGVVLTTALKSVFERDRPELFESGYTASFYSFPSGHATVAVGFYGTLAILIAWRLLGFWRWAVVAAGFLLVLLIGYSRMYLGVHYPTDILAGYLAAPLWVGTVTLAYLLWRVVRGPKSRHGEEG